MPPRKPKPGRSLAEHNPELVKEWSDRNEYSPYEISYGSDQKKVWWVCGEHGDYLMSCNNKTSGQGCKKCSKNRSIETKKNPPYNKSLAFIFPHLIDEYSNKNDRSPFEVYPSSNYKALWVCPEHGEYEARCANRTKKVNPTGCPKCWYERMRYERTIPPHKLSLEYLRPDLLPEYSEKNSRLPSEVYGKGNYKAIWKCLNGHEDYEMSCERRDRALIGCIKCRSIASSNKRSTPMKGKSMGDLFIEISSQWAQKNDRSPYSLNPGADYLASWVCSKCRHEWNTFVYNRTGPQKTGCPKCANWSTSRVEESLRLLCVSSGALPDQVKIGKWTVDIYFPDSKTVVEYDGSYAHSFEGSLERDRRKSIELLDMGYGVIRIREQSRKYQLESLGIENANYHEIFYKNGVGERYSSEPTDKLIKVIKKHLKERRD